MAPLPPLWHTLWRGHPLIFYRFRRANSPPRPTSKKGALSVGSEGSGECLAAFSANCGRGLKLWQFCDEGLRPDHAVGAVGAEPEIASFGLGLGLRERLQLALGLAHKQVEAAATASVACEQGKGRRACAAASRVAGFSAAGPAARSTAPSPWRPGYGPAGRQRPGRRWG